MKRIFLFYFFILAIVFKSNGQSRLLLEGTIGNKPIVLLLARNTSGNTLVNYFYKDIRRDHELFGIIDTLKQWKLEVKSEEYDNDKAENYVNETIVLTRSNFGKDFVWNGYQTDTTGKRLAVNLEAVDLVNFRKKTPINKVYGSLEEQMYVDLKLSGLTFIKDSITVQGKYQIQWEHDTLTKLDLVQIRSGFEPSLLKKINRTIRQHFYQNINQACDCVTNNGEPGDYEMSISEIFISNSFISIQSDLSWFCGGAHPGTGDNSLTIDAKTGDKIYELDEIFWFTGLKPVRENDSRWMEYNDKRGEAIKRILTTLFPKEMREQISEDSCDYSSASCWEFPSWYFTKKGFYIGATFPHANAACDKPEFSYLPNTVLKKYLNKEKHWELPPYKN